MSIDRKAFYQLSYGVFLLSSKVDGRDNACIINTAIQSASDPRQITISCIKGNYTQEMIEASGVFNISVLTQECDMDYIAHFGTQSGHDVDKCSDVETLQRSENGLLYESSKNANAYFSCSVESSQDLGSHVMYTGTVVDAQRLGDGASITYGEYQARKRQGTSKPKENDEIVAWRCVICGYIYEGAQLPEDFVCPLCGHGSEDFEPLTAEMLSGEASTASAESIENEVNTYENGGIQMDKWVCKVCGYVYEGAEPPAECPVCHVGPEMFEKVEGEMKLAAEHEYGVYAKTVANNENVSDEDKQYIKEQLMANFNGECSEVGMYLCMARIAHREGYPEIGLYWEKAAYEEAEHAAKFAELLGEDLEPNMKATTKDNLAWRVDCEFGATAGKVELATCAKKNGLDAIHDTVHEMARDEARHGKALKGLLERYFG